MASFLKKFIDLLFYSNCWIALCALAMSWQTEYLLTQSFQFSPLIIFIFSATLFLYAVHRLVGLRKVTPFKDKGRYFVIDSFKSHIFVYAILGGIVAFWSFWQLRWETQLSLLIPAILSLGYVLPVISQKRRLRDLHFIKIFLVAIVWAAVTVLLPVVEAKLAFNTSILLLFVERACFIFAITLPFDIRDLRIDTHTQVKTIPSAIGIKASKWLAYFLLLFFLVAVISNTQLYTLHHQIALMITAVWTALLVWQSDRIQHDYFFTGLMDGTMILQFLLIVSSLK